MLITNAKTVAFCERFGGHAANVKRLKDALGVGRAGGGSVVGQLNSHKIGNSDQRYADGPQKRVVRHEIWIHHQRDATNQRHRNLLLSPVNEKAQPDGAEHQAEQKG